MPIDIQGLVNKGLGIAQKTVPQAFQEVTLSGFIFDADPSYDGNGQRNDGTPVGPFLVLASWKEHLHDDANRNIVAGTATLTIGKAALPSVDRESITMVTKGDETWKVTGSTGEFAYTYTLSRHGKGGP